MNDGRIMAADLHYYANSGNTADESLLVSHSSSAFHRSSLNPKSSLTPNTRRCLYACHRQCLSSLPPPFLQVIEKILLHLDNAYNMLSLCGHSVDKLGHNHHFIHLNMHNLTLFSAYV